MTDGDAGPAICTIIARNYLAQARVLVDSFLAHHPQGRAYVLVIDSPEPHFDPAGERFTTLTLADLSIPGIQRLCFAYGVLELSTAVKPFLLEHLLSTHGLRSICYLDPDIQIFSPLDELWEALNHSTIILTPHLTDAVDDDRHPGEQTMLLVGAYNLGFIAIARSEETQRFLHWWQRRLLRHCIVDLEHGLFVDQRWVDLVPGMFDGVFVLRHPGYNVAYWNLAQRRVVRGGDGAFVNGAPLRFLHFSGVEPDRLEHVSRHQNRLTLGDLGDAQPFFQGYGRLLNAAGYGAAQTWSYGYATFENGEPIYDLMRQIYRAADPDGRRWPAPFETRPGSFYNWLGEPSDDGVAHPLITNLALALYQQRPDLAAAFPRLWGSSRLEYARWFVQSVGREYGIAEWLIEPMRESIQRHRGLPPLDPLPDMRSVLFQLALTLSYQPLGRALRRLIGRQTILRLKRRLYGWRGLMPPEEQSAEASDQATIGATMIGYFHAATGIGESARGLLRALRTQDYPASLISIPDTHGAMSTDMEPEIARDERYPINIWHINADQSQYVRAALGEQISRGRYNIGFWYWELEQFPKRWHDRFAGLDEIWVASSFTQAALAPAAPVPLVRIRPAIEVCPAPGVTRATLALPEDRFLFLFAFDMFSVYERKNPFGLIEAYRRAFGDSGETALVLKVSNLQKATGALRTAVGVESEFAARLVQALDGVGGVLIDQVLDRATTAALYDQCDCFVSLHRAEGFGLSIAEAMYLGKPCIATAYSSNLDFMTGANSYLVNNRLIELERDYGPYPAGAVWADPDLDHAAELMRQVVREREQACQRGETAAADIRRWHSRQATGRAIVERLRLIEQRLR